MAGDFLYGIDFCLNASNPGTKDPEGHYTLGYGFIQRSSVNGAWTKVTGFSENVAKNQAFGFQFYDLSQTVTQIQFVTIDFRPGADAPPGNDLSSPFSSSDEGKLRDGQGLQSSQSMASRGCGDGTSTPSGSYFAVGPYTVKNAGHYEMTVELRLTNANGQVMLFKCDPEMIVDG